MNSRAEWASLSRRLLSGDQDGRLKIVVLAAHPDDETIGASALLGRFQNSAVAYLTDGAPRDRSLWSPDAHGSRDDYGLLRRKEAENALALVDLTPEQITWLGGTDQEAIFDAGDLTDRLIQFLDVSRPSVLITHPYEGGHPDHDAAALVASLAVSRVTSRCVLAEMTSYHAESDRCVTGRFLNNAVAPELVFELSQAERAHKRSMMAAHSSQREVLSGFVIDCERVRPAPEYDFSRPPHSGSLWYERMGWEMTGERWRSLAQLAVQSLQERNAAHGA